MNLSSSKSILPIWAHRYLFIQQLKLVWLYDEVQIIVGLRWNVNIIFFPDIHLKLKYKIIILMQKLKLPQHFH